MTGIDIRWSEDDYPCQTEICRAEDFRGEQFPMQGIILAADDEDIGLQLIQAIGQLDRIPISSNRVFLEARSMGYGAGK